MGTPKTPQTKPKTPINRRPRSIKTPHRIPTQPQPLPTPSSLPFLPTRSCMRTRTSADPHQTSKTPSSKTPHRRAPPHLQPPPRTYVVRGLVRVVHALYQAVLL